MSTNGWSKAELMNSKRLVELYKMLSEHDAHIMHIYGRLGFAPAKIRHELDYDSLRDRLIEDISETVELIDYDM